MNSSSEYSAMKARKYLRTVSEMEASLTTKKSELFSALEEDKS